MIQFGSNFLVCGTKPCSVTFLWKATEQCFVIQCGSNFLVCGTEHSPVNIHLLNISYVYLTFITYNRTIHSTGWLGGRKVQTVVGNGVAPFSLGYSVVLT